MAGGWGGDYCLSLSLFFFVLAFYVWVEHQFYGSERVMGEEGEEESCVLPAGSGIFSLCRF